MTDASLDPNAPAASMAVAVEPPPIAVDEPDAGRAGARHQEPGNRLTRPFRRLATMPSDAYVALVVSFLVVTGCVVVILWFLGPANLFADNTPAGGDMGAHVWGPAYLRDSLLPEGRLAGWTPDWYAGFPAYQFYMVVPSLAIALLSYVIPYGVAFKLVAVSGLLTLPVAAWAFGKLADLPFPTPPLLAVGATVFLFDRSFSIYGGNIPSTLAGEFAFSIALTFAMVYLGVLMKGLRTGRLRGWAAVLLALTGLCHLIPLIFAVVCTAVALIVYPAWRFNRWVAVAVPSVLIAVACLVLATGDELTYLWGTLGILLLAGLVTSGWQRVKYWMPTLAVGGLLTAWWTVPFYLQHKYMNDMGWEKIERYRNYLFDRDKLDPQLVDSPKLSWVIVVAAAGLVLSFIWGRRGGIFWGLVAGTFAILFIVMPQGRLWNARLLPFYYLSLYLLAMIGIAEIGRLLALLFARDVTKPLKSIMAATAVIGALIGYGVIAMPLRSMPFGGVDGATGSYQWGPFSTTESSFIPSWATWNFSGYEGKPAYPEYYAVNQEMARIGEQEGCGRAMWEHEEQHDRYGTPMALMLMPFWTDGCIGSMEGLYFEASSTTPYHFLNQDQLSSGPSNAQRDLPYGPGPPTDGEFDRGIQHLKMLGTRYYMAISDRMKVLADAHPDLQQVGATGPWKIYELTNGADLVQPLPFQPAVVTDLERDHDQDYLTLGREDERKKKTGSPWQFASVEWYENRDAWDVHLAESGPADWQRVPRGQAPKLEPTNPVTVSDVVVDTDSISFEVSEPGTPVLVKASYFPNWTATGAEGPYRVTPNLMVVVPTSTSVELTYGYTGIDWLAWLLTMVGIAGAVALFRLPAVTMPPTWAERRAARKVRTAEEAALAAASLSDLSEAPADDESRSWESTGSGPPTGEMRAVPLSDGDDAAPPQGAGVVTPTPSGPLAGPGPAGRPGGSVAPGPLGSSGGAASSGGADPPSSPSASGP
jgi:hypothetical protein